VEAELEAGAWGRSSGSAHRAELEDDAQGRSLRSAAHVGRARGRRLEVKLEDGVLKDSWATRYEGAALAQLPSRSPNLHGPLFGDGGAVCAGLGLTGSNLWKFPVERQTVNFTLKFK
jgi:hypothetical protein